MNVSPDALRKETVAVYKQAHEGLQRTNDDAIAAALLLTKAQCLNTLVLLNEKRPK